MFPLPPGRESPTPAEGVLPTCPGCLFGFHWLEPEPPPAGRWLGVPGRLTLPPVLTLPPPLMLVLLLMLIVLPPPP
jgi:hypothetical protein